MVLCGENPKEYYILTEMFLKWSRLISTEYSKPLMACTVQQLLNSKKTNFEFKIQINTLTTLTLKRSDIIKSNAIKVNSLHTTSERKKDPKWVFTTKNLKSSDDEHSLIFYGEFQKHEEKNKKTFLETIRIFSANVKGRTSHVDFVKAALRHMKEYGVERDLESYKKILDVFPKGVFICTNVYMAEAMHFPRQQFATLEILSQMETHGVIPDVEVGDIISRTFGVKSHPYQKYARLLYWSLKMKNKSPWLLPATLPSDPLALAKLAIQRITSVDIQTIVSVYQTSTVEDSIDKTWIVSGQSPKQKELLSKHSKDVPVIVEGGDVVWLREKSIGYFILKCDGEPLPYVPPENCDDISNLQSKFFNPNYKIKEENSPNVHVQDDGTIYAVCATGTSSKDSLLSWVRILEKMGNPILVDVPVLFRFKQAEKAPSSFTKEVTVKE